jgi:hypothetical protein
MPPQALHRVRVPTPKPPPTPSWLMGYLLAIAFRPEAFKTHAQDQCRRRYCAGISSTRPSLASFSRWVATFCSAPRRSPAGKSAG